MEGFDNVAVMSELSPLSESASRSQQLMWTHFVGDAGLGLTYLAITVVLLYATRDRQLLNGDNNVIGVVIAFTGLTGIVHLASVFGMTSPIYFELGLLKAISAALLVLVAICFWPLLAKSDFSPVGQLRHRGNDRLAQEIERRKISEQNLAQRNRELEALNASLDAVSQDLKRSDERLKLAIEGGELGLWDWNIETNEDWFSDRWLEHLGYRPGEIDYHFDTFLEHLHPDDSAKVMDAIDSHLKKDLPYNPEFRMRTKSGEYIWVEAYGKALRDAQGEPTRMSGTLISTTERRKALHLLDQRTKELERSNADLANFAYVASHDLQEPIRKIVGFSQLLERNLADRLDETSEQYLNFMADGAKRMQRLIQDLLAYSRVGNKPLSLDEVDVRKVVSNVALDLKTQLDAAGAQLVIGDLPVIWADEMQLEGLLENLIGNAIKYRRDEPLVIEVGFERCEEGYLFSVKDNGIGIAAEHRDAVFEIFKRLHGLSDYPGTGIGLAICKQVAERHRGRIWVKSVAGEGSEFKFIISDALRGSKSESNKPDRRVA